MIREVFAAFLARLTDLVLQSRNRARIVIGTDRKDSTSSGYGDGGQNDPESASIDLVAGFDGSSGDMSFVRDKSRIYLSGKTDPDDYIGNSKGSAITAEPAILGISDNIVLKARNKVKIVSDTYSIIMTESGEIEIECNSTVTVTASGNKVKISASGIELDAAQGLTGKIITDNDLCVGIDPVSGGPIISNFKQPGSLVTNNRVFVK
jgi:hypothetical protein